MATRKLIIAALCCGLAILLAGGLWLVATGRSGSDDDTLPLLQLGQAATVDGIDVTVADAAIDGDRLALTVESTDVEAAGVVDLWVVLSPTGELARSADAACGSSASCVLTFSLGDGAESLEGYTATFTRDGEAAAWLLG